MARPVTTLFMLMSLDGKISTGAADTLDFDADLPHVPGVAPGLHQYYEIEQTTDLWCLNTGRVMEKIGVNTRTAPPVPSPARFVILDEAPHLTAAGVAYMCRWAKELYLVTANPAHPAFACRCENLHILRRDSHDLAGLLTLLGDEYGADRITIQSGGTVNGAFVRGKLLDYVDIVVAPLLVGGGKTPTLADGGDITSPLHLGDLLPLVLESCTPLEHSYVRLRYRVLKEEQ